MSSITIRCMKIEAKEDAFLGQIFAYEFHGGVNLNHPSDKTIVALTIKSPSDEAYQIGGDYMLDLRNSEVGTA